MVIEPRLDLEFLNTILDTMSDPLFVKDEAHRWIVVNKALCDLMGQRRENVLGKTDHDFFPPEEAATFWQKDEEVFASGGVNINEEPFTDADGKTHTIITKKTIFIMDSGEKALVGIIRDITDLKLAQEELQTARDELELRVERRTREMREAQEHLRHSQKMEAVGQLTGGVAHDFNNILAVILSSQEMIRADTTDRQTTLDLTSRAIDACERGATLTHRLLAFSRRQTLQPEPTDVCDLVRRMLDLLGRTIGEKINVRAGSKIEGCIAKVDAGQLETAILNLCINARDSMPEGGDVTIEVSPVRNETIVNLSGDELPPGDYVMIEVTDTGAGMDRATINRAFEPFFTTKEVGRGSGLGLSMVYGFVSQSGGGISITSAIDRGTTVKLFLPRLMSTSAEDPLQKAGHEVVSDLGRGRAVLVVEDDPGVRQLTVMLVESLGFSVAEAGSADEALELIPTLRALDILLTDVVIPGVLNGPQLAEKVVEEMPTVKVLFMSGNAGRSLDAIWGDRGYRLLEKPFGLAELATALEMTLVEQEEC